MRIAILQHDPADGPGTLGAFLNEAGTDVFTVKLDAGESIPRPEDFDVLISMGGPMHAWDENEYPFLDDELILLRKVIPAGIPVFGFCLGGQLMAKALGAEVRPAAKTEIGWRKVGLTEAGRGLCLFDGLPDEVQVFQYHYDTFQIPSGGELLASSPDCRNQAFHRFNAVGFQFHVEVDRAMLEEWFKDREDRDAVLEELTLRWPTFSTQMQRFYANLLKLAEEMLRKTTTEENGLRRAC